MNRHYDRLGAILNTSKQRIQSDITALFARRDLAEFFDVCAGDECAACADQDRRPRLGVGGELLDSAANAFRNAGTERIYRRVVDRNDCDVPVVGELD